MSRIVVPLSISPDAVASHDPMARVWEIGGATMGTRWSARIALPRTADVAPCRAAICKALDQVVGEMSQWEQESAISRFNRAAAGWHPLPLSLLHVLDHGLALARQTGGAFNPVAGALADLWGFGAVAAEALPPPGDRIEQALVHVSWEAVTIDHDRGMAWQPGGARLDFSGIAKGYGVDRAATALRDAGVLHFLVEVGGELRGEGLRPDGQPWWVEVEQPPLDRDDKEQAQPLTTRVALHQLSIATSGDYRRFFESSGRRYSHSIDPRTGYPIDNGIASVTVIHPECMAADALATALTVLGPDEGLAFAGTHGISALFTLRTGNGFTEITTPALDEMLD